ncbi:shikimate kinase [Pantanalinema sp. GBBB05]|uniref:shikimate kinase n=1 Tax=Pantanalinema sp. GBBB05 TaxID=2604139 RepID=UPI001D51E726|nr:shikimate kinase [Pantanalinema sp. GBBB05]
MSDLLKSANVYLIGMMGSGKSTVGQLLAQQLGYQFFDTDTVIEQYSQQSIATLFAEAGEAEFRTLETQVLAELAAYTRLVIATGGGIVLRRENWSYLRHGVIVWLDVPLDEIQQRLQADTTRPLLQATDLPNRLKELMAQRRSLYAQADVHVLCAAKATPEHIAHQVIQQIEHVIEPEATPPDQED